MVAPQLLATPQYLLAVLHQSSVIRTLAITIPTLWRETESTAIGGFTTLFARLAPTLRHLDLRLHLFHFTDTLDVSDHIVSLIARLPHLNSLALGGDIALGVHGLPGVPNIATSLAHLPIEHLHLRLSVESPFEQGVVCSDDLLGVLSRTELYTQGVGFAKLRTLRFDYENVYDFWPPISFKKVCRRRGIQLKLCKVEGTTVAIEVDV